MSQSDFSTGNSLGFWIAGLILVIVVAGGWLIGQQVEAPTTPFAPAPNVADGQADTTILQNAPQYTDAPPVTVATVVDPVAPSFDTLRVAEDGVIVAAGRANPGDEVLIYKNAEVIDQVSSNDRGEWVWVPDVPLPAGNHALQLRVDPPEGPALLSEPVMVLGPPVANDREGEPAPADTTKPRTVVALGTSTNSNDVQVLQRDDTTTEVAGDTDLALETVQWGPERPLSLSGAGPAGESLALFMDGDRLGSVVIDNDGRWQFSIQRILAPGDHTVGLQLGDAAPQNFPFTIDPDRDDQTEVAGAGERVIVIKPGNNLWRIAEATYGSGFRYTLIFQANQDAIANPNLIYPGQVFRLPDVTDR